MTSLAPTAFALAPGASPALPGQAGPASVGAALAALLGLETADRPWFASAPLKPEVKACPRPAIVRRVAVARPDLDAERLLCERAHAGDRAALGQILRRHGPSLYRAVLLPRLGSDAAAQDALADTYARVVERFHQFQWQNTGVYPWLRVIALRIALDVLRARKRETLYEPADLEREIDESERDLGKSGEAELSEKRDQADARGRVHAALAKVNPRYAEAIRLRVLEERSREEVAAALGVSVATFDVVLHRALTALKKALGSGAAAGLAGGSFGSKEMER
ncbi:MAG: RNA polymerase sigma factor [Byssovorax sp.]